MSCIKPHCVICRGAAHFWIQPHVNEYLCSFCFQWREDNSNRAYEYARVIDPCQCRNRRARCGVPSKVKGRKMDRKPYWKKYYAAHKSERHEYYLRKRAKSFPPA